MPVLLASTSALFAALAAVLIRKLVRAAPGRGSLGPMFLLIAVLMLPGLPWLFSMRATRHTAVLLAAVIVFDFAANLCFFEASSRTTAHRVAACVALAPVAATFAAMVAGTATTVVTVVICAGVVAAVVWSQFRTESTTHSPAGLGLALLAAGLFGVSSVWSQDLIVEKALTPYGLYFLRAVAIGIVATLMFYRTARPALRLTPARTILALCSIAQWLCLLTALRTGSVTLVITIAATAPALVAVFAIGMLHERPSRRELVALPVIVAGIAALALVGR